MITMAKYSTTTGQVLSLFTTNNLTSATALRTLSSGIGCIEIPEFNSEKYYIDVTTDPHSFEEKTTHPLTIGTTTIDADGTDECVITGIHNPSRVTWPDGVITTVTDGEVRFSVDLEGDYTILIDAIPYLTETINVSAITPA